MEDIFGIVIVLLIYAAVIGTVRKRSAKRGKDKKRTKREPQFEAAFEEAQETPSAKQTGLEDVRKALAQAAMSAARQNGESQRDCQTSRVHLHEVTQEEMDGAGEGEDPCHGGHAPDPAKETADSFDAWELDAHELSQDVLRGVIMSEILTRPCERRMRSTYGR